MLNPSEKLPANCGNFLADLPRYLGLSEPAFEKEEIFPHVKGCPRCKGNFGTAREIAGAFHGLRPMMTTLADRKRTLTVERAVSLALRENKLQLAEVFFELGQALLLANTNQDGRTATRPSSKSPSEWRQAGVHVANDLASLTREEAELKHLNSLRGDLAHQRETSTPQQEIQEAFRYLTVCREIVPNHERAAIWLGLYYRHKKEAEKALAWNSRILKESLSVTRWVQAHINSSEFCCILRKDFKKAMEHSQRAHRLDPGEPTGAFNYACHSMLLGEKNQAYKVFEIIENDDATDAPLRTRAQQLLRNVDEGPIQDYFHHNPRVVDELSNSFPGIFNPEVTCSIRGGGAA